MKKIVGSIILVFFLFLFSGCGSKGEEAVSPSGGGGARPEDIKASLQKETPKAGGMADVCEFFPKELVEKAIGKAIVKVEVPIIGSDNCYYYTEYKDNYANSYSGGKKPGGPKVVVVYDSEDFAKDKVSNEKSGNKYTSDSSIGMDNFVVRNNANKIWMTALVLGGDKYIRFKFMDDAVTGDDLVKIAKEFATKIK